MARNRTPNEPIGSCPCPFKGCQETGTLHRFRAQTDNPSRRVRAGKLYMMCPLHGMIQDQEWLLVNGDIPGGQPLDIKNTESPPSVDIDVSVSDQVQPKPPQNEKMDPPKGKETPPPASEDDGVNPDTGLFF